MRVFRIIALFLVAIFGANIASAQSNMAWSSFQYNDDGNRGRATAILRYGVPETDNVLIEGSCVAGSGSNISQLIFGGPVYDLALGSQERVEIFSNSYNQVYFGAVFYPNSGEGVGGVRLELGNNDRLWDALRSLSSINYVVNRQTRNLSLRGSSRAIDRFLQACRSFQRGGGGNPVNDSTPGQVPGTPPGGALPTPSSDPRHATCDTYQNEVSRRSTIPVTVRFVNRSDGHRSVMWIGFDGVPKEYASLNPGQEFTINTFVTHPWMFTDGPGNCLEMFMPQQGVRTFEISAPGRYFGDE